MTLTNPVSIYVEFLPMRDKLELTTFLRVRASIHADYTEEQFRKGEYVITHAQAQEAFDAAVEEVEWQFIQWLNDHTVDPDHCRGD